MKNLTITIFISFLFSGMTLAFQVCVVDSFDQAMLISGMDGGINVGYNTFAGGGASATIDLTSTPPTPLPGANAGNKVLELDMTIPLTGFTGYIHNFTNNAGDTWIPMNWSTYEGIRFWLYGSNTGGILFIDIIENRNPGSMSDDAERWSVDIPDNFTGWQLFEYEWSDFSRKEIGNGAPNDGLTLTEVHGYAIGGFGSVNMGTNTFYVDSVAKWGNRVVPVEPSMVQFSAKEYTVLEGQTAIIQVVLDKISPDPVTVHYSTAESQGTPGRDYTPVNGMVTIPANTLSASFPIQTFDNEKADGDLNTMIVLLGVDGAEFGICRQTRLTIEDDELFDPTLIDDFEGCHPFQIENGITATVVELEEGSRNAEPCQGAFEFVLEASGNGTLTRNFAQPQDWSANTGLSFWYYGTGSGEEMTIKLKDNRTLIAANTMAASWELVWSDEFNDPAGTAPNPNIWQHQIGDGTLYDIPGWGNDEEQYYTNDLSNISTDGSGNLVITLLENANPNLLCKQDTCEYTSARLVTKDKIAFEYGRIEARIQVPDGEAGLWPAFWALGTNIDEVGWPQAGEIDIMEYVSRMPTEIFGTIHGPGYSGGLSFGNSYDFGMPIANAYHTFTIEWIPDEITWYVDGIMYHQAVPSDVSPNEWVFNHPFYLLLNMAIGGNFGGSISNSLTFPQSLLIDYIRVYQAPETAECFEASFIDNQSGWQFVYLPFDEFTRSLDQPAGAPDDGLGLNEVWGYCLQIPDGATASGNVYLDQVRLANGIPEPPCSIIPIPAMGEWGVIILGMILIILGIVRVKKKRWTAIME